MPKKIQKKFWLEPIKDNKGRVYYDYSSSLVSNLEWHCGCTYYDKVSGLDGRNRMIKVGCDYIHYWDEGRDYNATDLEFDVKKCIVSFWNLIPDYKLWCHGNGKIYSIGEGMFTKDGHFISNEWTEQRNREKLEKEKENVRA